MYLRSVQLLNWRSYNNARFDFPKPVGGKNVTVIMAPNEYGKTSFFESIVLGLFGREGIELVLRARGDSDSRVNYSRLLEGILHRRAVDTGSMSCSVLLDWEDGYGEPIRIRRTWHFNASERHKSNDDELIIYEGSNRHPLSAPAAAVDKDAWYRGWIKQRFLEPSLARFFLFDGEEVQSLAKFDAKHQVREGIKGLLGLPILEEVKNSLEEYAQRRDRSVRRSMAASVDTINALRQNIGNLEGRIREKKQEQDDADSMLRRLSRDIDELERRLAGRQGDTTDLLRTLIEQEKAHEDQAEQALGELETLLAGDVALALAGVALRQETVSRLQSEATRENWEAGRSEGSRNLGRFADDLAVRLGKLTPPIHGRENDAVVEAAKAAWEALWHPLPVGCADTYLHPSLMGTSRDRAVERLESVGRLVATDVLSQMQRFNAARDMLQIKRKEHREFDAIAPELEELNRRYGSLMEQQRKCKEQSDMVQREIDADTSELEQKQRQLAQLLRGREGTEPALKRAADARAYAKLIDDLTEDAVNLEADAVGQEMTRTWKAMAHHADRVDRIEISPDFEIRMLTPDGVDIHQIEKSAGANQIFTQALITAITKVSERIFPFVIDTPLARLSREQRLGVLKTFAQQPGQVILLSTDQEVVDDKFDVISDRVGAYYKLELAHDRGVAITSVGPVVLRS